MNTTTLTIGKTRLVFDDYQDPKAARITAREFLRLDDPESALPKARLVEMLEQLGDDPDTTGYKATLVERIRPLAVDVRQREDEDTQRLRPVERVRRFLNECDSVRAAHTRVQSRFEREAEKSLPRAITSYGRDVLQAQGTLAAYERMRTVLIAKVEELVNDVDWEEGPIEDDVIETNCVPESRLQWALDYVEREAQRQLLNLTRSGTHRSTSTMHNLEEEMNAAGWARFLESFRFM